jgi:hypothetical protein
MMFVIYIYISPSQIQLLFYLVLYIYIYIHYDMFRLVTPSSGISLSLLKLLHCIFIFYLHVSPMLVVVFVKINFTFF